MTFFIPMVIIIGWLPLLLMVEMDLDVGVRVAYRRGLLRDKEIN